MSRTLIPVAFLFLCFPGLATQGISAEATVGTVSELNQLESAAIKFSAADHLAKAKDLQKRYRENVRGNPKLVVDAAVEYAEAHRLYEKIGDTEGVVDSQAELFWCKKQMNYASLREFVARSGGALVLPQEAKPEVKSNVVPIPLVIQTPKDVPPPPAKPVLPVILGKSPRPDERTAKAAFAQLRTTYVKEYGRRTFVGKRALARRFIEGARQPATEAGIRYAMLQEAAHLAQEAEDYGQLGDAAEQLEAAFNGINAKEYQRAVLQQMKDKPVAVAILALFADPGDAQANLTVGRYFCFELRRWDVGLGNVAKGTDPDLKWLANEDLTNPTEEAQRVRLGDAWYDMAKRAGSATDRNGMFDRAQRWYSAVIRTLEGPGKSRIEQRLAEIDKALPMDLDTLDWQNVTPGQWEKLRFPAVTVSAKEEKVDAKLALKVGERIRIVPHPEDVWTMQSQEFGTVTTGWKGVPASAVKGETGLSVEAAALGFGAVVCWLGDSAARKKAGEMITGTGQIYLAANRSMVTNAVGSIRVKLVPMKDD